MKFGVWLAIFGTACLAGAQSAQDVKNKEVPAFLRQLADTRKTIADGYFSWTEAGKDAIRAFYSEWCSQKDKLVEQKFENINSVQQGDLLIDSTKYSGVLIGDGKEVPFKGKRFGGLEAPVSRAVEDTEGLVEQVSHAVTIHSSFTLLRTTKALTENWQLRTENWLLHA
jgi:hypothetical protein